MAGHYSHAARLLLERIWLHDTLKSLSKVGGNKRTWLLSQPSCKQRVGDTTLMRRLSYLIQWNLFITDTLVQGSLSVIKRCPLLGGWFKNASVTHIKYFIMS